MHNFIGYGVYRLGGIWGMLGVISVQYVCDVQDAVQR